MLRVLPDADRVVVEGVNLVHKHLRKSQKNPQGGRVRREASVHALQARCPSTRPRHSRRASASKVEGGEKVRVARKSGAVLDSRGQGRGDKRAKAEG